MSTAKDHKKFTASGDPDAEMLLEKVLLEMKESLSGSDLCVVLGGSYGRGGGGVRLDRENGILYNDLDFFVFAEKKVPGAEALLKEISEKYEKILKVDVDFSAVMTIKDIRNNASRLMMQELKRGYVPVCGKDLLAENLTAAPPEELPFSEACRLLLNRGMGLLLAGEKIAAGSCDTDFILRNIYKAVLGAGDAIMLSAGTYRWQIEERLELVEKSPLPGKWKSFYREAAAFKTSPHRQKKEDMVSFWKDVREFFQAAILSCAGSSSPDELRQKIYANCCKRREVSLKNFLKYCIKSRSLPSLPWKYHFAPAVAVLAGDLYRALEEGPRETDRQSKLYQQWLIFN